MAATMGLASHPAAAFDWMVATAPEYLTALAAAAPGDNILLAPGTYFAAAGRTGLQDVTITSQDPNNPAILDATVGSGNRVLQLSSASNVVIEHLIFQNYTGNGINIDDADNWPAGKSTNITIRDVIVRNTTAPTGNSDGIKLSGVDGFVLERVQVSNWGERGSAVDPTGSHNGRIENSRFSHPTLTGFGSGIRPKGGSSNIVILGNYLEFGGGGRAIQAGGATPDFVSRYLPGKSGFEAEDVVAAGNIVTNAADAFVWVNIDGGEFRYNLIEVPTNTPSRATNEQFGVDVDTQNGVFGNNIIEYDSQMYAGWAGAPGVLPGTFTFFENQWHNRDTGGPIDPLAELMLPTPETGGIYGVDSPMDTQTGWAWDMPWGIWIVNPHLAAFDTTLAGFEDLFLATATGGLFDPLLANPLLGSWSLTPLADGAVSASLSQLILIHADALNVPAPAPIALVLTFGLLGVGAGLRRRLYTR
jgi:hypothetical protein